MTPSRQPGAKSLDALNEATQLTERTCLFPEDREIPPEVLNGLQMNLSELSLQRARVFGDCWLACRLGGELQLSLFWRKRLPEGRAEVPWCKLLELLTVRQLVGTPRARWEQFIRESDKFPRRRLRDTVEVKPLAQGQVVHVLAKSEGRRAQETAIRRRQPVKLL